MNAMSQADRTAQADYLARRVPRHGDTDVEAAANSLDQAIRGAAAQSRSVATQEAAEIPAAPEVPDAHLIGSPTDEPFRQNIVRMFQMVDAEVSNSRAIRNENSDLRAEISRLNDKINEERNEHERTKIERDGLRTQLAAAGTENTRLTTYMEMQARQMMQALGDRPKE